MGLGYALSILRMSINTLGGPYLEEQLPLNLPKASWESSTANGNSLATKAWDKRSSSDCTQTPVLLLLRPQHQHGSDKAETKTRDTPRRILVVVCRADQVHSEAHY